MGDLKKLKERIEELSEVVEASEKLFIKIISLVGWILILVKLFS